MRKNFDVLSLSWAGATGEPEPRVSASSLEIRVQFGCALESNVAVGLCVECLFLEMRP